MANTRLKSPSPAQRRLVVKAAGSANDAESTLVRFVRRQLLEQIEQDFSTHLRIPPIRQIADEFGVSVGTANQAIKDLVAAGLLVSRPRLGTTIAPGCAVEHVQRRIEAERASSKDSSTHPLAGRQVMIMTIDDPDAFIVEMSESFARRMTEIGARVRFEVYPARHRFWPKVCAEAGVDAVAIFQPPVRAITALMWDLQLPLLVVASDHVVVDAVGRYDVVSVDDEQGAYLAGRRMRDAGCERACFVGGRAGRNHLRHHFSDVSIRRLAGFERGWGESVPEACRLNAGSYDIHWGARIVQKYVQLDPRPDAVFCATDDLAIGFAIGSHAYGLTPAEDFSLIGFDKQQRAVDMPSGPLTTVEVPRQQMGERGAELLSSRLLDLDQPVRQVRLGCSLFEGRTTQPLPESSSSS